MQTWSPELRVKQALVVMLASTSRIAAEVLQFWPQCAFAQLGEGGGLMLTNGLKNGLKKRNLRWFGGHKMSGLKSFNTRRLSVAGFSFLCAYILSFQFEGQVLYSLLDLHGIDAHSYIMAAIIAHFAGLFTCGLFVKSQAVAKSIMLIVVGVCLAAAAPSFLPLRFYGWAA